MADAGSRAIDKSLTQSPQRANKVVRSQKIIASAPADRPDDSDELTDNTPPPLPRSHTPGHLASKSSANTSERRLRTAELAARQRSQSTSVVSSPASTSSNKPPPLTTNGVSPADSERPQPGRRPSAMGISSVASSRQNSLPSGPSRALTGDSRQIKGQHTAFPPLQDPEDAPDVPATPASGMYWSRAPVSGAPHPSLRAHTTTLIGSNIYVFGGCDARACFNDLYVLDADAFYWSRPYVVGDVPMPLRAMTCTAVGKKLVVFGGGDGPTYYNDIYVLDTVNFRWSRPRLVGDRVPSKRRAHTACLYKNGIYVFGGGDGIRALNDIWRLDVGDTTKMSWKLISSADKTPQGAKDYRPKARGYHTANMVGSKLIIFGGSDGGECFDDVWVYDVDAHYWKSVSTPVMYRRLSHTATVVGSYLFVIGGHDGSEYSNDVLLLNLVTMTWDKRKTYGKAPSGRGYHGTVLYDSRLIAIGGFDGSEVFRDVMMLELAVHSYYSQISHFTIEV
jgi:N-acetylneuraminic acid mutarotase